MKYFIFRNYTIEPFFRGLNVIFSGYDDVSFIDAQADRFIWWYFAPYKTDNEIIAEEIKNYGNLLEFVLNSIGPIKPIFVFLMQAIYKIDYQTGKQIIEETIKNYNERIINLSRVYENLKVIDFSNFINRFPSEQRIDWKYFYLSQIPLNPKLAKEFINWFTRQIEIIELQRKKCIVLDLDNTLWGGILGEDGENGIKIGETYPGNCFLFFQEYLLQLSKNGIILAVCSKNNEEDIVKLWNTNPYLKIRQEQLAAYRINWNNKSDNIQEIAEELNIGLDSLVFVDDNPSERELVRQLLPQICVPDFPEMPYYLPEFIKNLTERYFSIYQLTQEDIAKTQQYKKNLERKLFQKNFADFDSYLRSLEIELTIEKVTNLVITRIAQLTQKTNQFNLTTQRYTEADIRKFVENDAWIYDLRVKDRFGDHGLTGLIIINKNNEFEIEKIVTIDSLLLSCRILGKHIELAFVQYVLMKLKKAGIKTVMAKYIKTQKNSQVKYFYEKLGFEVKNTFETEKQYNLNLDKENYSISNIYKVVDK